jgi:glyoxylate reductase
MTTRPVVIVTRALPPGWLAALDGACEVVTGPADRAGIAPELAPWLGRAEGLLCMLTERIDDALLERMPRLRVVSNMAVGLDNLDLDACRRRGILVGHTPGVLTDATADLAMALLLAAARGLPTAHADACAGRWGPWSPTGWLGLELRGATLGIVGFGAIGQAVARRASAFGMELLCATRSAPRVPEGLRVEHVELRTLLQRSDVVSLHVPLQPSTRHLIGAVELAAMKAGAILVNTARGDVVDQDALLTALRSRHLGFAALDVTSPEPLPPTHPLWSEPRAYVVPHLGSATDATRRRMAQLACENLLAGLRGARLPHAAPR